MKKLMLIAASFALVFGSATMVSAGSSKRAELNRCIRDNKGEGQSARTVQIYCKCMWQKWPDNSRTKTITQWEKTAAGKRAEKVCARRSGWKGK